MSSGLTDAGQRFTFRLGQHPPAKSGVEYHRAWMRLQAPPDDGSVAAERVGALGYLNVHFTAGNGSLGWPEHAPYDAIMVSGAVARVPQVLLDQLKPGGRLFAIEGAAPAMQAALYTRVGDAFRRVAVFETVAASLLDAEPAPAFAF